MQQTSVQANRYKLFAVGALGTFMATLDGSIVNVALPTIARELGASVDLVAWVVLAYSLTLIALMLIFGAWVQSRGYFFGYRFGFIFFILGSIVCTLAPGIYTLIAGRVVQAIGTAMFAAIGPGMVTTVFPENERGKGIGMMVMMVSAGFMTGPPIGGFLLGIWSWHAIFTINIPIGLIGIFMVYRYFGVLKPVGQKQQIRWAAALSMSAGLVALVSAMKMVSRWGMSDIRIILLFSVALLLIGLYVRAEASPKTELLGLRTFRNRQFTTALVAQQIHFVSLSGVALLIPFYLEQVKGFPPAKVGLFLVVLPILMFIVSPLSGKLSDRIGYRILTSFGMAVMAVGLLMAARFDLETSVPMIVSTLAIMGVGIAAFSSPNSSAFMGSVTEAQRAVTSSILATNRNIGHSMGVGIASALYTLFELRNIELGDPKLIFLASFRPVAYLAFGVVLIGVLLCLTRSESSRTASRF